MRTELATFAAILCTVVAASATAQDTTVSQSATSTTSWTDRLSVGAAAEVDLVGLAYGVRPEVLFRPFGPEGRSHLRLAAGVMQGPELTFVPVNLGYRLILSPGRPVRAHLGTGLEWQNFWFGGEAPVSDLALYAETGFEVRLFDGGWVGLQYAPDIALTRFGIGFATRLTFRYDM